MPKATMPGASPSPVKLNASHDRTAFNSGNAALDTYLKQQATQDARRGIAMPYVIADAANRVIAYYTLTSSSVDIGTLPDPLPAKLPSQVLLGATLLGRMAVDRAYQHQGLGSLMVVHAVDQTFDGNPAASIALMVDAIDNAAVEFYRGMGFKLMPDSDRSMFFIRDSLKKWLK